MRMVAISGRYRRREENTCEPMPRRIARRLLDAASEVFAERGVDAPLNLIAERAGSARARSTGTSRSGCADRRPRRAAAGAVRGDRRQPRHAAPTGWDGARRIYIDGVTAMYFDLPWMVVVARACASTHRPRTARPRSEFRAGCSSGPGREGSLRTDVDLTDLAFVTVCARRACGSARSRCARSWSARLRDIIFDGLRAGRRRRDRRCGGKPLEIERFRDYLSTACGCVDAA